MAADDNATKLELVRAGLGLTLIEKHEAAQGIHNGAIVSWEPEPIHCVLSFAYAAKRQYDPRIHALHDALVEIWRDGRPF